MACSIHGLVWGVKQSHRANMRMSSRSSPVVPPSSALSSFACQLPSLHMAVNDPQLCLIAGRARWGES